MTTTSASRRRAVACTGQLPRGRKARKRPSKKLSQALNNRGFSAVTCAASVAAIRGCDGKRNSTATTTKNARPSGVEFSRTMLRVKRSCRLFLQFIRPTWPAHNPPPGQTRKQMRATSRETSFSPTWPTTPVPGVRSFGAPCGLWRSRGGASRE